MHGPIIAENHFQGHSSQVVLSITCYGVRIGPSNTSPGIRDVPGKSSERMTEILVYRMLPSETLGPAHLIAIVAR